LIGSDTFTGTLSRVSGEKVGTYALTKGSVSNANYSINFVSKDLTITKKAIEITADAKSKTYGDADPTLTYQITSGSLVGSDSFTGTLSRVAGENIGAYALNNGSLVLNSNYDLSLVSNDLSIAKKVIEITADVKSKTYGDVDPTHTYQITSGSLVGTDVLSGSLTRVSGENVGTYALEQGTVNNTNYSINFVSKVLSITKKTIEITADAKSKTYGDSDIALTYQITSGSLIGSDSFTGSLSRLAGENVGTYAIAKNTLALNNNYNLNFVANDLTINKRSIEITANNKTKFVGSSDPVLDYTMTKGNLVFSDLLAGSLNRVSGETVKSYVINKGSLDAGSNYNMNFVAGIFTITNLQTQSITFNALTDVV
ncbi:MAG: hypothetical protein GY787_23025, partial [Alteromonadales bacterium]|nr:hypothetical protein [Alteromonadales bacterium]